MTYRPLAIVLFSQLVIAPCPLTHDRLGRPIVGPCLLWTKATDRHGYGVLGNRDFGDKKIRRVHRVMYAVFNGLELDEFEGLDHLCRVHSCAAPSHLEEATQVENIARGNWGQHWQEQRAQAHCIKGHPFDEANTYWSLAGYRGCRICRRQRWVDWDQRRRAAGLPRVR